MIHKFISGLSANEKKILLFAVLAVVVALFDRLLITPSMGRLREIDDSIAKEENIIRQNLHFLAYRDRIVKDAGDFKDYFAQGVKAEEEVIAGFLKKVELLATQSNVQISKLTPAGQVYEDAFLKYMVTVDCSAATADLANFVYAVNSSRDLFKVEKMALNAGKSNPDSIQASLTISQLIIGADPSQDARSLVKIKVDKEKSSSNDPKAE